MNASQATLAHISDLVRMELAAYLPADFVIAEVTSESLPGPDGDDYIRTTVIFEDDHPELDARALNKFSLRIDPLCAERGLDRPTIAYADRSEIPA
ncbi:MAG: hypothetical protein F4X66_13245 [Chloroflexi bacterium]|nr:hypothetical protein [Chloroflexota bacterium]MYE39849.1 hypothetical protein [Chloroflexota bacterium]